MNMNGVVAKKYQGILIQFLGPDGQAFLQRLASTDIIEVKEGYMIPSSFLDAKASILAVFYIFKKHSQLHLLVSDTYKQNVTDYIDKMHFSEDIKLNIENVNWLEARYEYLPSQLKGTIGYTLRDWNINQRIIKGQMCFKVK